MTPRISDLRSGKVELPGNSKINIKESGIDKYEIEIPKTGFKAKHIYLTFFSIFWLAFITFWTFGAAQGSVFFALFSIPFWIVGLLMMKGLIISIFGTQKISIERDKILIIKDSPFSTKELEISYNELQSIELQPLLQNGFSVYKHMGNGGSFTNMNTSLPTISYLTKEETIGESLSANDQKWLVNYLNEKIVPLMKFIR